MSENRVGGRECGYVKTDAHKQVWEVWKVKVGEMEREQITDQDLHVKLYLRSTLKGKERNTSPGLLFAVK